MEAGPFDGACLYNFMPIYEYHCLSCKKDHEIIQKFSDPPLAICPACGGKLEKKLSLSSFQLKGGGWYKEGYASTPPPKKTEEKPASPKNEGAAPKKESKENKEKT